MKFVRLVLIPIILVTQLTMVGCATVKDYSGENPRLDLTRQEDRAQEYEKYRLDIPSVFRAGNYFKNGEDYFTTSSMTPMMELVSKDAVDSVHQAKTLRTVGAVTSLAALGALVGYIAVNGISEKMPSGIYWGIIGTAGVSIAFSISSDLKIRSAAKEFNRDLGQRLGVVEE